MSNIREKAIQGVSYLTINRIVRVIFSLFLTAISLRYFGPSKIGVLAVANSVLGIIQAININTAPALQTYLPEYEEKQDNRSIIVTIWLNYIITSFHLILIGTIIFLFSNKVASFYKFPMLSLLLKLIAVRSFAGILRGPITDPVLLGLRYYRYVFISSLLNSLGNMVALGFVLILKQDLIHYVGYLIVAPLMTFIYSWVCFSKILKGYRWDKREIGTSTKYLFLRLIKFSIPTSFNQVLVQIRLYLGKLISGKFLGAEATGYFAFAANIMNQFAYLLKPIAIVLLPVLSKARIRGREFVRYAFEKGFGTLFLLSVISSGGFCLFAKEITMLLGGLKFLPAVILLQIYSFHFIFRAPMELSAQALYAHEKPTLKVILGIPTIVCELLLFLLLIPKYQLMGLVVAVIMSWVVAMMLYNYFGFRLVYYDDFLIKYKNNILSLGKASALIGVILIVSSIISKVPLIVSFPAKGALVIGGSMIVLKKYDLLSVKKLRELKVEYVG